MDRRRSAHPICRGPRFLYAELDGKDPPEVCDTARGTDRAICGFGGAGGDQFCWWHSRAGNFSTIAVARGGAATCAFPLHVCGAREVRLGGRYLGPIRTRDIVDRRGVWVFDDVSGHGAGVFPGTAGHVPAFVRSVDVWRYRVLHSTSSVFLFCVWKT